MELSGMRVAVLAEDIYEDLELWYPKLRLTEAGATVHVLGTGKESYQSKRGYEVPVDGTVDVAKPEEYSAVIIPGGYAPDKMRVHEPLVDFVRAMNTKGRVVAYICHAGWVAASAGIVFGTQTHVVLVHQGRHDPCRRRLGGRRGRPRRQSDQQPGAGRSPRILPGDYRNAERDMNTHGLPREPA